MNPIVTHSLKAPGFNPCAYKVKNWFQAFAFKWVNLYRYAVVVASGGHMLQKWQWNNIDSGDVVGPLCTLNAVDP